MLDAGLILYVGLLVLLVWRFMSGWRCCGAWLEYANYCILLYMLLLVLNVWAIASFYTLAFQDPNRKLWEGEPRWMRPLMLGAPIASLMTYIGAFIQTGQHVDQIRRGAATMKHDRAVQIIALPAVYCCMAMSSLSSAYESVTHADPVDSMLQDGSIYGLAGKYLSANHTESDRTQLYIAQVETCYQVADVYEAWALFQFCKLTLELLRNSFKKVSESSPSIVNQEDKESAHGLLVAHAALTNIAYNGVLFFLTVCVLEAGWSLYRLTFTELNGHWALYNSQIAQFSAAGFVASGAAIYNVHTVESQFHAYFEGYGPYLKFFAVKVLLSIAYFQSGIFWVLQAISKTLPSLLQQAVSAMPFLQQLIDLDTTEYYLFFSALVTYECFLTVIIHSLAWPASEEWYNEPSDEEAEDAAERKPILVGAPLMVTQHGTGS
jgi:hypothetical protein